MIDEGAAWYARRRTERIRSSVFWSRSERCDRAIVARVCSRFLDTDERRRGRDRAYTRGHAYTQRARCSSRYATRERDPRRKARHAAGSLPTLRALLHFRRRLTAKASVAPRRGASYLRALSRAFNRTCMYASGTFSLLMRDTHTHTHTHTHKTRVRGHFCFHNGMQIHTSR